MGITCGRKRYDRVMADIFDIQDDISLAILDKLKLRLVGGAHRSFLQRYATDVESYNVYLKGRYHLHQRTPDGFRKAADYFEQVIDKDARIAPAYAGLADCCGIQSWYGEVEAPEVVAKARRLAQQALEIDPELGQAHYTLGLIKTVFEWDWAEAQREFAQAIRQNPNNAIGRCWHAVFCLAPTGRLDEAMVELQLAVALEPLSPLVQTFVGMAWILRRNYDDAAKSSRLRWSSIQTSRSRMGTWVRRTVTSASTRKLL